jgi:hypothetical protein
MKSAKRRIGSAACLWVITGLSVSCSATSSAPGSPPVSSVSSAPGSSSASASPPAHATVGFTVGGANPVPPNGSQDTSATTPNVECDSTKLAADKAIGHEVVAGFSVSSFPAAAALLTHFLKGEGTEIGYAPGSSIEKEALASSAFLTVNEKVQGEIALQLRTGDTRVQLSAAQLPTVAFESTASDLYWGFRGTQGLTVTGRGSRKNGRYVGTLSYVIRDSYGFPADDTLAGFGPPMRYLQTVCGAPQHAGGAHWFPDTITVTVPFNRSA